METLINSKFISVTIDGSIDFMGEDLESVYVRVCNDGNVEDLFVNIGDAESAPSSDLFDYLMSTFSGIKLREILDS